MVTINVLAELEAARLRVSKGDRADLKRLELELCRPDFARAAIEMDAMEVLPVLHSLGLKGPAVKAIERALKEARAERAEAEARDTAARLSADRRRARDSAERQEWRREERKPHPVVLDSLDFGKSGPKACFSNALKIVRDDPRWGAAFRVNRLGDVVELDGHPVESELLLTARLTEWIADAYGVQLTPEIVRLAVFATAELHAYHPVRDWLGTLKWDEVPRFDLLLSEVLGIRPGVPDPKDPGVVTPTLFALYVKFLRRTMIGAVARVLDPGCKMDTALIFVGTQGFKKSSFFRDLFGAAWFGSSPIPIGDKNAAIQLRATWGYEAAELESLSKKSAEDVKAFLSEPRDLFRHIYEKNARFWPRHSVIVGSTNRAEFLIDPTGSRRFWPIPIPDARVIDLARLRALRTQLWAEALDAYRHAAAAISRHETPAESHRWWFEREEDEVRAEASKRYEVTDVWDHAVATWATGRTGFVTADVMSLALKMSAERMSLADARRVGAILRRLGFEEKSARRLDGFVNEWRRNGAPEESKPPPPKDDEVGAPYVPLRGGVPY